MPHQTVDPVVIGAQIVSALQSLVSRMIDPADTAVLSITNFNAGTGATNVIPDTALLQGSVRTLNPETRDMIERRIGEVAAAIAQAQGASVDYAYSRLYDPVINNPAHAALCAEAARDIAGPDNVDSDVVPSMAAEDFSYMLGAVPGCYIWIGQGEFDTPHSPHSKGLHHPGYDFNDAVLPIGIAYWASLAARALPSL
jgi:hippurate hydrolase